MPGNDIEPIELRFANKQPIEIIRIEADGRLFWRGREVETDDDFRAAMMELHAVWCGKREPSPPETDR